MNVLVWAALVVCCLAARQWQGGRTRLGQQIGAGPAGAGCRMGKEVEAAGVAQEAVSVNISRSYPPLTLLRQIKPGGCCCDAPADVFPLLTDSVQTLLAAVHDASRGCTRQTGCHQVSCWGEGMRKTVITSLAASQ